MLFIAFELCYFKNKNVNTIPKNFSSMKIFSKTPQKNAWELRDTENAFCTKTATIYDRFSNRKWK